MVRGQTDSVEEIFGGVETNGIDLSSAREAVQLLELTGSGASLRKNRGGHVPPMAVSSTANESNPGDMWLMFVGLAGRQNLLDFDSFAYEWKKTASLIEEGRSEVIPICRKTTGHLKA